MLISLTKNLQPLFNSQQKTCIGLLCLIILATSAESAPVHNQTSDLEQNINTYIRGLRTQGVIDDDETTAWSVYDFTSHQKLVSINEDIPHQSASMIKPFVGLAYFYQLKENPKKYRYTQKRRWQIQAMLNHSSNSATNYFIDLVGHASHNPPLRVETILKTQAPDIFRQTAIVEHIPANGKTYRNLASARDYSRFLYALWHDRFPFSQELKRLMSLPNADRMIDGVEQIPEGTIVYDKTGTTARLCGNMGIIEAQGKNGDSYPYTFIAIIEKRHSAKNFGDWIARRGQLIRTISGMVYSTMKKRYNLK